MMFIIGNVIALVASILMVYSGIIKTKKKIVYVQSIQIGLSVISNLFLKGIAGAIINAINFIRNILCYKEKLGTKEKVLLTIISVILIVFLNNKGIIGYLPLISAVVYIWLMTIKDIKKFKLLIMVTTLLWLIYDFSIKLYTAAIFDFLCIVSNAISISKINKNIKP